MQDSSSSVKAEWKVYMEKAEIHYLEDTAAVESGKKELEEVLHSWYILLGMMILCHIDSILIIFCCLIFGVVY